MPYCAAEDIDVSHAVILFLSFLQRSSFSLEVIVLCITCAWTGRWALLSSKCAVELSERRADKRAALYEPVEISWNPDEHSTDSIQANGVDISRTGAAVQCRRAFAVGSVVFIYLSQTRLMGIAYVRHCTPQRRGFRIGFAFEQPLLRADVGTWTILRCKVESPEPESLIWY